MDDHDLDQPSRNNTFFYLRAIPGKPFAPGLRNITDGIPYFLISRWSQTWRLAFFQQMDG